MECSATGQGYTARVDIRLEAIRPWPGRMHREFIHSAYLLSPGPQLRLQKEAANPQVVK